MQSLGFADPDNRHKILELLDNPILYKKFPDLLDYIYQLGCEQDGEKRYYAAVAASELATKQPFLDLKEGIILPWAKSDNPWIQNCASVALAHMLEYKRNESEVLMLLRHWISSNKGMLVNTGLSTFFRIARFHSIETLEAVRITLTTGLFLHCLSAIDLFGIVYDVSPIVSIEQLYSWLIPIKNTELCRMAAPLFLIYIRLDDATESESIRGKVVEMIVNLWDTPTNSMYQEIQEQTTIKIQKWASEVLAVWNKESPAVLERYLALFHELHRKYEGQTRNRLKYHLDLWEKRRLRKQAHTSRGKRCNSLGANEEISYYNLVP